MTKRELTYRAVVVVATTVVMLWALPSLVRMLTDAPAGYPYVQYSSVMREFCLIDYSDKSRPLQDLRGRRYTNEEFDSIMPLLNFRQLVADGRQPDSLMGVALTPNVVMAKSVVYSHYPFKIDHPRLGLYVMFESASKRLGLELPDDIFEIDRNIAFRRNDTNEIDTLKSRLFNDALLQAGFSFPCRWVEGNMSVRKRYDEGYFALDADGRLFHLKMVEGRPFVRDTRLADSISVTAFAPMEPGDRRFYGFMMTKGGDVYILERDSMDYKPLRLDIGEFDPATDNLRVMGNMLFWTVTVQSPRGSESYALETQSLRCVDSLHIEPTVDPWLEVARWLFPFYIESINPLTRYVSPQIVTTGFQAMITNVVAALLSGILYRGRRRWKVGVGAYVLLTGIAGMAAVWLVGSGKLGGRER